MAAFPVSRCFLACIALGVAAIAGVASISRSLTDGLGREGKRILGGDLTYSLINREATSDERAVLDAQGKVSVVTTLRAMALAGDKGAALVEMKAVDGAYPAAGDLVTDPDTPLSGLLAEKDGVFGAVADPLLLTRLDLKVGDRIEIAGKTIAIRAILVSEPDKIANGIGFGPRLLVSAATLQATGLIRPGSLNRWSYRIQAPEADDAELERRDRNHRQGSTGCGLGDALALERRSALCQERRALHPVPHFGRSHRIDRRRCRRRQCGERLRREETRLHRYPEERRRAGRTSGSHLPDAGDAGRRPRYRIRPRDRGGITVPPRHAVPQCASAAAEPDPSTRGIAARRCLRPSDGARLRHHSSRPRP